MLTEGINVLDWRGYTSPETLPVAPEGVRLNQGHPFSVFHLDAILHDPQGYANRDATRPFGVIDTAEFMLWYLFGITAGEPAHVIQRGNVYHKYAELAITRLNRGEDTGLVHEDTSSIWESLTEGQRKDVASLLYKATTELDEFPNLGKMNVIFTNQPVSLDIGPLMPEVMVPVVVETRNGMATVLPSLVGLAGYKTRAVASASTRVMGTVSGADIKQTHMWDIGAGRIRLVKGNDAQDGINMVCALCQE